MATKRQHEPAAVDSRGKVRIYADISKKDADELAILAIRTGVPKKEMLARIIRQAVAAK